MRLRFTAGGSRVVHARAVSTSRAQRGYSEPDPGDWVYEPEEDEVYEILPGEIVLPAGDVKPVKGKVKDPPFPVGFTAPLKDDAA